jgi:hypothetical protein
MFPVEFALDVIETYSDVDDLVIDPFCGRGTTLFLSDALGRRSFGVEVNAVGWTYAATKLKPARESRVLSRLRDLDPISRRKRTPDLPPFFARAYSTRVLKYISAARTELNWRESTVDRTAMAMLLLYAHGDRKNALSNQMRQTKAMSPPYAMKWWAERDLNPPELDPVDFLESRIAWRYLHGTSSSSTSRAQLGDSTVILPRQRSSTSNWSLLLTSPPYIKVANYHYDQWLRLWLLGGPPHPVVNGGMHQSWFGNPTAYRDLLQSVFSKLACSAARNAVVYVRTDARRLTREITIDVLRNVFPKKSLDVVKRPLNIKSQTSLYNDGHESPGEVDLILT